MEEEVLINFNHTKTQLRAHLGQTMVQHFCGWIGFLMSNEFRPLTLEQSTLKKTFKRYLMRQTKLHFQL